MAILRFISHILYEVFVYIPKIMILTSKMKKVTTMKEIAGIINDKEHDKYYTAVEGRYFITSFTTSGNGYQKTFLCSEHTPEVLAAKKHYVEVFALCPSKKDLVKNKMKLIKDIFDKKEDLGPETHVGLMNIVFDIWVSVFFTSDIKEEVLLDKYPSIKRVAFGANYARVFLHNRLKILWLVLKFRYYDAAFYQEVKALTSTITDGLFGLLDDVSTRNIDFLAFVREQVPSSGVFYGLIAGYYEKYYSKNRVLCTDYSKSEKEIFQDMYEGFRNINPASLFRIAKKGRFINQMVATDTNDIIKDMKNNAYSEEEIYDKEVILPDKFKHSMDHTFKACPFGLGKYRCGGEIYVLHFLSWLDQVCQDK